MKIKFKEHANRLQNLINEHAHLGGGARDEATLAKFKNENNFVADIAHYFELKIQTNKNLGYDFIDVPIIESMSATGERNVTIGIIRFYVRQINDKYVRMNPILIEGDPEHVDLEDKIRFDTRRVSFAMNINIKRDNEDPSNDHVVSSYLLVYNIG